MTPGRDFIDYLQDILDSIAKIDKFTHGMNLSEFEKDDKTIYAVIRAMEILGEATKKVPVLIRNKYPEIPWREIAGMRDKLIHDYFGVNHDYFGVNIEVVWKTAKNDVPSLKPLIEQILNEQQ